MKLATPDRKVESHITDSTSFAMAIDEDALHHVMDQLAGLYKDQFTAILREYTTNGVDAHKMAGVTRPVEVTLPKPLAPSLKIRDYGIGLDVDDLRDVYSKYGASTKRDSNDFNGQLGFGCKAALAYSDVFNVTSVKDGAKTFAAVSKETGVPLFHVLAQDATSEPNGTVVEVPVGNRQDQREFARCAQSLYRWFDRGTVLVDGVEIKPFDYNMKITDDLFVVGEGISYQEQQSVILMGNVAYPTELEHCLQRGYGIVARVPIGAVEIQASREGLKERHPKTVAAKKSIEARLAKHFRTVVQRDIDAATTPAEALKVVRDWRNVINRDSFPKQGTLTYKGHAVPTSLSPAGAIPKHYDGSDNLAAAPHFTIARRTSSALKEHTRTRNLQVDSYLDNVCWVTNYSQSAFTPTTKKKLNSFNDARYAGTKNAAGDYNYDGKRYDTFILCPGDAPDFWIDKSDVIDWVTDIKPIKLNTDTVRSGRGGAKKISGSYDSIVNGTKTHVLANDIDTSKPLFWMRGNNWQASRFASLIQQAHPNGYTFVWMPMNRVTKFLRDFPTAQRVEDGVKAAYAAWKASFSTDQLKALWMRDANVKDDYARLSKVATEIDDPDIREAIRIAQIDVTSIEEGRRAYRYVVNTADVKGVQMKDPLDRYSLLGDSYNRISHRARALDHLVVYLNAAYAAFQAGTLK